jgi:hypothetical protein
VLSIATASPVTTVGTEAAPSSEPMTIALLR